MAIPTMGRIVHFVLKDGTARPAIVIAAHADGVCELHIFLRPIESLHNAEYVGAAEFSPTGRPGTWHWPDRSQTEEKA